MSQTLRVIQQPRILYASVWDYGLAVNASLLSSGRLTVALAWFHLQTPEITQLCVLTFVMFSLVLTNYEILLRNV